MKNRTQKNLLLAAVTLAGFAFATSSAFAAEYYWDSDGATPGFGNTTGTWGTNDFWSTDATGSSAINPVTTTTSDTVNFGTATLDYGASPSGVAVSVAAGGVSVNSITFGAGQTTAVTIGTLGNNITMDGVSPTFTINSPSAILSIIDSLLVGANGYTKDGPGKLYLDSGTATTYTNLTGNVIVKNGILDQQARLDFASSITIGGSGSAGASFLTGRIILPPITVNPPDSGTIIIGNNTTSAAPQIRSTIFLNSVDLTIQTFNGLGTGTLGLNNNTGISGTGNLTLKHQANGGTISISSPYALNPIGSLTVEGDSSAGTNISGGIGSNVTSLTKSGTAALNLNSAGNHTGDTTINGGTLRLGASGTLATTPNIVIGSGATLDVSAPGLFLGSTQTLKAGATGATPTGTITVASGKNLTLGNATTGLEFTAYSGGATAPLTLAGSGGNLDLNGTPIKVTTTSTLPIGAYTLIANGGSAKVSGTPGALITAGSGLAANGILLVSGSGDLVLVVTTSDFVILNSTTDPNGTVTPTGATGVNSGGSQAYTITPDPDYAVDTLTVNGAPVPPATSYTFSGVTSNQTIVATFASAATLTAPLYWDSNSSTAGFGSATGTWGASAFWTTDPTGGSLTTITTTTGNSSVNFGSDTANYANAAVAVASGGVSAREIAIGAAQTTPITLGTTNETITLAGGGGVVNSSSSASLSNISDLTLNGANVFNAANPGGNLILQSGAFTRGTQAVLNVQGAGTVSSTMPGLTPAAMVNGIVGPWASFGTAEMTKYATFSGNNIVGYTGGTAAADATQVTSTDGTVNYDLAAGGTLGAGASVNTLRYTGAVDTIAGALTAQGIMNASASAELLTLSDAVNSTGELVVHAANGDITLNGGVVTTSGFTTTGGTVTLGSGAVSTLAGGWTVNGGTLVLNRSGNDNLGSGIVNRGGTALFGNSSKFSNSALITVNSGGILDVAGFNDVIGAIAGEGTITSSSGTAGGLLLSGSGTPSTFTFPGLITGPINISAQNNAATITLTGANTYTGGTFLKAGKLIAGTDSPAGAPGAFGSTTSAIVLGSNQTGGSGGVSAASDRPTLLIGGAYTVGRAISVGSVSTTNAYIATIGGANTSGTSTYTGNITLAITAANYTLTLQAATGGTVVFRSGTWANTGNRAITIGSTGNTGTVKLSNALAGTTGAINVSFGTFALGANNVIPNASPITIGSAILDATNFGDTAGTLDVTGSATLNLGTGGSLFFADSSAVDWTGGTLNITGNFVSGASVRFGTTDAGLNFTQLGLITVNGSSGPFTLDKLGYLTAPPASPYNTWAVAKGLTGLPGSSTDPAKTADPDKDGKNNLEEFAFDGNPLSGANDGKVVGKVATVSSAQVLTLTLPVRSGAVFGNDGGDQLSGLIDGIYYRIEGGTDLVNFAATITEVLTGEEAAIQAVLPPLSTGWSYRTFRTAGTVPTVPKDFMRAKISETP